MQSFSLPPLADRAPRVLVAIGDDDARGEVAGALAAEDVGVDHDEGARIACGHAAASR